MTTLYKPVLIESAEQAEALALGTIATREDYYPAEKWLHDTDDSRAVIWGDTVAPFDHEDMVGWTALVPIEAVEEHVAPDAITYSRYVTAWEEA